MTIDISKFYLIEKQHLVHLLFNVSMFLAMLTSLRAWFLWPIVSYFSIISSLLLICSWLISNTMDKNNFSRSGFIIPITAYILLGLYQSLIASGSILSYIQTFLCAFIFLMLFKSSSQMLQQMARFIAQVMGIILIPSIFFFLLYLIGIPLPNSNLKFQDAFYTFSNYYFFLIEDGQINAIIPRFQSIFPEPAYVGRTAALILQTQRGQWKKWYNITLLIALLLSFSLAGYVYLTVIIFLNLWVSRKKFFLKIVATTIFISIIIGGAFVYNQGDNLIHNLILLRLEVNDGELAGNNRTTEGFDAEFENYINSGEIIFGRHKDNVFGDSGYKVFVYSNGIIGVLLLFVFYFSAFYTGGDYRAILSALFVFFLIFIVDAFVLWFGRFIPLYCTAHSEVTQKDGTSSAEDKT